jgi:hypothetical protein
MLPAGDYLEPSCPVLLLQLYVNGRLLLMGPLNKMCEINSKWEVHFLLSLYCISPKLLSGFKCIAWKSREKIVLMIKISLYQSNAHFFLQDNLISIYYFLTQKQNVVT